MSQALIDLDIRNEEFKAIVNKKSMCKSEKILEIQKVVMN